MNDITNITTGGDETTLAPVPTFDGKAYAVSVFEPFKKQISKAKREDAKAGAYDITTGAGMGRAKELRAMFRDIRTGVENVRKERKAPIIEAGKLLDARAAEIKAEVEPFEDKYDREIKAEEQRKADEKARKEAEERARVEAIENRIAQIRGAASRLASADSAAIKTELNTWTLLRLEPTDYQEYLEDALTAVNTTIDQLTDLLAKAEEREAEARRVAAEREELARLKAEQAERDRVAAEEKRRADEAAAESARQLAAVQAQQATQQRIMNDVMALQSRANLDGNALDLREAIEQTEALVVDAAAFGDMVGMAQMAKDMALTSLRQKLAAKIDAEEGAKKMAEQQRQLAEIQGIAPNAPADELVQVPAISEGDAVVKGVPIAGPDAVATLSMDDVESPLFASVEREFSLAPTESTPEAASPTYGEVIELVQSHFGLDHNTTITLLRGLADWSREQ